MTSQHHSPPHEPQREAQRFPPRRDRARLSDEELTAPRAPTRKGRPGQRHPDERKH